VSALSVVASALILGGVALSAVGGIGLLRFPNVFARMHAATKPAVLGLMAIASGAALEVGGTGNISRLVLVIFLQLVTAPIAAHMVGRAAHSRGADVGGGIDELAAEGAAGPHDTPTAE